MAVKWLSGTLVDLAYDLTLCTNVSQFHKVLKNIKLPREDWPPYLLAEDDDATAHFLRAPDKRRYAIVCVSDQTTSSAAQTLALLVHEAVHVWQWHCDVMGEDEPSREFEAYSIQAISQSLIQAYIDARPVAEA